MEAGSRVNNRHLRVDYKRQANNKQLLFVASEPKAMYTLCTVEGEVEQSDP